MGLDPRNENPQELIAEILSRLNKGAVELSDQEIRHALFAGKFDNLLMELSKDQIIQNFKIGKSGQSQKDSREGEELVLRYFAFKETGGEYNDNLARFLDKYMENSLEFDEERVNELRNEFTSSMNACRIIFDDNEIFSDINKERNRQGVVYYDLLMNSLGGIAPETLRAKRAEVRAAFSGLCSSPEFKRLTAGGLQRKTSIARRNQLWRQKLEAAIR